MSLVNDNALIVFPKVSFDSKFNLIKSIDSKLEKILLIKVINIDVELKFSGYYINSSTAHAFNIRN